MVDVVDNDAAMRKFAAGMPVPNFEETSFTRPKPLSSAKVAIVTSAAIYREGGSGFVGNDFHYETLPKDARDLKLGHLSPNLDRGGFAADINVAYPIDRLNELAEKGVIGEVAEHHYSFAGNQPETVSELRLDTGPQCAQDMLNEGVDVVLLTPV